MKAPRKRWGLRVAVLLFSVSAILYSAYRFRILPDRLAGIYSSFAAKEGCSCLFVVRASKNYCKDYVRQFFSPDVWVRGQGSLEIEFHSFFSEFRSKAVFEGKEGCKLLP